MPGRPTGVQSSRMMSMTSALVAELAEIVGPDHVLTDPAELAAYTTDWRGRFKGAAAAVVRPGSTAEVAAIMTWAFRNNCGVVPQGGNTGLTGAAVPDSSASQLILSLGRMCRIRWLDQTNDTIVVDAGCTLAEVQAAAALSNRLFPLSLGSEGSCQIGGNIATNAGGLEVLRYGSMRDLVLGLEVVLPNGDVLARIRQLRKDNTGYDLKQLFIGSEGTLGIITAAALKLFPRPRSTATALCGVKSPDAALECLTRLKQRCGPRLSTFEIFSGGQMDLILHHTKARSPLGDHHPWCLLVEITEPDHDDRIADILTTALSECVEAHVVTDAVVAQSEAQRAAFWALRHSASEANLRTGRVLSHDTSVPVSRNAEFIRKVELALSGRPDIQLVFVGHLGDGNVHAVAIFDRDKLTVAEFEAQAKEVGDIVYGIAASLDGSISAEHGIGVALRDKLPAFKDPRELDLMRSIKAVFDPTGIMNPGKVLAAQAAPSCR
jgi:FAD/FMN-containing dehydrogenase